MINSSASNHMKIVSMFSSLLTPPTPPPPSSLAADDLQLYNFTKKVKDISSSFTPMPIQKASPTALTSDGLTWFSPLTSEDVHRSVPPPVPLNRFPPPFSNTSHGILPFLTTLIKSSLTSGLIPTAFKTATVKPLFKKPTLDSDEIQNYRPVSILSFLSKTLECASTTNCPSVFHKMSSFCQEVRLQDCSLIRPSSQWLCHSVPPEPRPTSQSSFFSTFLLCLIQSTTKSSSPLWLNFAMLTLL